MVSSKGFGRLEPDSFKKFNRQKDKRKSICKKVISTDDLAEFIDGIIQDNGAISQKLA